MSLDLILKIKAIVEGQGQVAQLGQAIQGVANAAGKPVQDPTQALRTGAAQTIGTLLSLGKVALGAAAGVTTLAGAMTAIPGSIAAFETAQQSIRELAAASKEAGLSLRTTLNEATKLSRDNFLSMADATRGVAVLLRQGFGLAEATQLLARYKEEAKLTASSQADVGKQVLQSASNVRAGSDALEAYAQSMGKTRADLTAAEERQVAFREELRKTAIALGAGTDDALEYASAMNALRTSTNELKVAMGEVLVPVFTKLAQAAQFALEFAIKPLFAGLNLLVVAAGAVGKVIGSLLQNGLFGFQATKEAVAEALADINRALDEIPKRWFRAQTASMRAASGETGPDSRADSPRPRSKPKSIADTTAAQFALARAAAEAEAKALAEIARQTERELEVALEQNLVSFREYYRRRADLREQAIQADVTAKQRELAAAEAGVAGAKNENARLQAMAQVKALQGELIVLDLKRREVAREAQVEIARAERELADALANVRDELARTLGTMTPQAMREAMLREFRPLLDRARAAGEDVTPILRLVDARVAREQLAQIEAEYNRVLDVIALREQEIRTQREVGYLTEAQAQSALEKLYRENAGRLGEIAERYREIAIASGLPDAQVNAERMRLRFEQLANVVNVMAVRVRGELGGAFAQFLFDASTGSKKLGDALVDALGRFRDAILRIIAERLGEQLVNSILGPMTKGVGSGAGGILGAILQGIGLVAGGGGGSVDYGQYFHGGGGVGFGATRTRAAIPAALLAAAIAFGPPRYHSGGEVLGVLKQGEEVLTEDDPRHVRNGGGRVTVNVYEAPGTRAQVSQRDDGNGLTLDVMIEQVEQGLAARIGRGKSELGRTLEGRYALNPTAGSVR